MVLLDQVIVVTGGAGLIGKEIVRRIAAAGAISIIADMDPDRSQATMESLVQENPNARIEALKLDITSKESLQNLISTLHQRFGRIDALVNNAYPRNKAYGRPFFEVEYADLCENLSLHLGGYFLASQQFAGYFKTQGRGNILNVSSIYGVVAPKFEVYKGTSMGMPVEYALIKSGLLQLTKYLAKSFKGLNIRVNAISPGGILDKQPEPFLSQYKDLCLNKGMLDPSDLAGTFVFLLSDASRYINGQNLIVDDGFTL